MSPTVIQTYDACFYCITNVPQVHLFQNFVIDSQLDNILGLLIIIFRSFSYSINYLHDTVSTGFYCIEYLLKTFIFGLPLFSEY